MKTAAIIPAYNEFERLSSVIAAAGRYVDRVVVVDDGSTTPLAEHLPASNNVTFLRHAINLGKGATLTTGIRWAIRAGFEAVVLLDADGQHNADEIPRLLRPIEQEQASIVFGVRHFHRSMPLVARIGNIFLTGIIRLFFNIRVSDTQSGFRAFRLDLYDRLKWDSARYAVETEMIVNAGKHRLRFAEVPISTIYHDRYRGTTIVDGVRIFLTIIGWRFQ